MPGITDFVKKNAGVGGKIGVGIAATEIATSESKLKSIATVLASIVAFKPMLASMFVGTFSAAGTAISKVVKESGALDLALKRIGKAAQEAGRAYERAANKMKEKAGGPWAEKEIQNTRNMTKAIEAITPAVAEASASWAKLTGGMAQAKSEVIRYAAESGMLSGIITGLSTTVKVLSVAFSALSAITLATWFSKLGKAVGESTSQIPKFASWVERASKGMVSHSAASKAAGIGMRLLSVATKLVPWGIAIAGAIAIAAAIVNWSTASRRAAEEAKALSDAAKDTGNAVEIEINLARTAEEQYSALASALKAAADARRQYQDAVEQGKPQVVQDAARAALDAENARAAAARAKEPSRGTEARDEARAAEQAAREGRERFESANASPEQQARLLRSRAGQAAHRAGEAGLNAQKYSKEAGRVKAIESEMADNQSILSDPSATDAQKRHARGALADLTKSRGEFSSTELRDMARDERSTQRSEGGKSVDLGIEASVLEDQNKQAQKRAEIDSQIAESKKRGHDLDIEMLDVEDKKLRSELLLAQTGKARTKEIENQLSLNEKQRAAIERIKKLEAEEGMTNFANSQIRGTGYAPDSAKLENEVALARAKAIDAQKSGTDKEKMDTSSAYNSAVEAKRQHSISVAQGSTSIGADLARSKMGVAGNTEGVQRVDNFMSFKERFDSLRAQLGDDASAENIATQMSGDALAIKQMKHGGRSFQEAAVSDLARIGGGGGVEGVSDVAIDIAREQKNLLADIKAYMAIIAAAGGRSPGGAGTIKP